jgi:hypothetical protein
MITRIEWENVCDQVKRATPLRQVFESLNWRIDRSGKRAFCGLCECSRRDPSISISDAKRLWRCHHCGKGGSVVDLIMFAHGVKFIEALKFLAAEARIPLPSPQNPREYARLRHEADKRQRRRDAISSTAKQLKQNERALVKWCTSWIHFCDDILAMPGPWTEEQWRIARIAAELRTEYLLPELMLLTYAPATVCKQYLEADEVHRMVMLTAVRNRGAVLTDDGRFEEMVA